MAEKRTQVEVTETRAIAGDFNGWMLLKRNKKKDKVTGKAVGGYTEWVSYSYPADFPRCAAALEEELIRTCGANTMTELRRTAERIHEMMLEVVKEGQLI